MHFLRVYNCLTAFNIYHVIHSNEMKLFITVYNCPTCLEKSSLPEVWKQKVYFPDKNQDQVSYEMEQPTAPQQVFYIIQMYKEAMANNKKSHLVRAATTLGGIHIVCGIGVLIASITGLVFSAFSTGEYLSVQLHKLPPFNTSCNDIFPLLMSYCRHTGRSILHHHWNTFHWRGA